MTRGGRPRDPEVDAKVLAATVEVLGDKGFGAMRIDDVARTAGVPKSTIYRRWPSVRHLVLDAMEAAVGERRWPDTGDALADLRVVAGTAARSLVDNQYGDTLFQVGAQLANDPELHADYRARLIDPVRDRVAELVRAGQRDGSVRPDVDPWLVFDELTGVVIYRRLVLHEPVGRDDVDRLVDRTVRAIRTGVEG